MRYSLFKCLRTPKKSKKLKNLNPYKTQNIGPREKKIGMSESFPKGYLHYKNKQNWRKKFFRWCQFTLICPGMPHGEENKQGQYDDAGAMSDDDKRMQ